MERLLVRAMRPEAPPRGQPVFAVHEDLTGTAVPGMAAGSIIGCCEGREP